MADTEQDSELSAEEAAELLRPTSTRRKRIPLEDMSAILARYKQIRATGIGTMEACEAVALEFGRLPNVIHQCIRRFEPTTNIAEKYLQAQAMRLAMRIVREANVEQAVDVLSRKNMGVLAPKTEEGAGAGGFFLSVQADTCGAVKIGVQSGSTAGAQRHLMASAQRETMGGAPPAPTSAVECNDYTLPEEPQEPYVPQPQGRIRQLGAISPGQSLAIERAKKKLKTAQRRERRMLRLRKAGIKV